jgi:uncharacterized protein (DUF427 family)
MKAVARGVVIAETETEIAVKIEGNWYFPAAALTPGLFQESPTPYTCPWKGKAQYFDIMIGGDLLRDAAWSYPALQSSAIARVGRDFTGFIAFDPRQVEITP